MNRTNGAVLCCLACFLALLADARAQDIEKKAFVGKWDLSDARVKEVITTVEFEKVGACEAGVWGRDFGGPNPIGANRWRTKQNELELVYVKAGRAREDVMLSGTFKFSNADEFEFKVTGGVYGAGKNRGLVFRLKKH